MPQNITFLGDSHIRYFTHAADSGLLPDYSCRFCCAGGATAVGMRNPNSKSNALNIFEQYTKEHPSDAIIIQLGEVDCGFVIWYRSEKYNESILYQITSSIQSYFHFVEKLISDGHDKIIITGAILPTITDQQDWGAVANLRREVKASLRQRTDLTFEYNTLLKVNSEKRGLHYIEITDDVLDKETRYIDEYYKHSDPLDHHLDENKVAPIWANKLNPVLKRLL